MCYTQKQKMITIINKRCEDRKCPSQHTKEIQNNNVYEKIVLLMVALIHNNLECKWPKFSNHKIQTDGKMSMGRHSNIRKDFNKTSLKSDERGHHVMIRGSIQQKDVTIVNAYAPAAGVPGYWKHNLMDLEGDISNIKTVIMGVFKTSLSPMDRPIGQKKNFSTRTQLIKIIDQRNLIGFYKTFHPNSYRIHVFIICAWNSL